MTSLARRQWTRAVAARLGLHRLEDRTTPDATYHSLAGGNFGQDWTNTGLITTDDNWAGVPSIIGYRGDGLTGSTGTDPQTIITPSTVVNVIANQTNPDTLFTGGVAEFHITNPTVALNGSGTADAPYVQLHLNSAGRKNLQISYNIRDLDGSTDNSTQQVALQYRFNDAGNFVNVPAGYVADATEGPSLAGKVTPVSVTLPSNLDDQATIQIRIITSNAVGNDEWVGIDDIVVTSEPSAANTPPTITSNGGGDTASISLPENTTDVTVVTATDPDPGTTITYSIGGPDAGKFTINTANGLLSFAASPNFEAPADANGDNKYEVTVTASDGTLTDAQAITVTITDANETPRITSNGGGEAAAISVPENTTAVTTVVGVDEDAGAVLTYTAVGEDAALFDLNPTTGVLTFKAAPDFETPADKNADNVYGVEVRVSDGTSFQNQALVITVTNANDAPVITSDGGGDTAAVTAFENATAVTKVIATDQDAGAAVTFSLTGGADKTLFAIDAATGVLTFLAAPNFELPGDADADNKYEVTVTAADGSNGTDAQAITVTVANVNEAPTFTVGANQAVLEDAAAQTVAGFLTNITAGPPGDLGTTVTFTVTNDNNTLFSVQPAIGTDGKLTYTLATDAFGTATVTVVAKDDGGTANGGVDTSAAQTFTITVAPVNDAPTFTLAADPTVNEDAGAQTIANFLTAVSPGPANEAGQTTTVEVSNDNNALFSVQPTIDAATGKLTFTPAADANGTARVAVVVRDNGGTADGGVDAATGIFTITVTAVNDAPTFALGANQLLLEDAGPQVVADFLTAVTTGPADESAQTTTVTVTNDNNAMFSAQPAIGADGKLTFTPAADAFGLATVMVKVQDTGGTANGGGDAATRTFTITVSPVNDAPTFVVGPNQSVAENGGAQSVADFIATKSAGPANEAGQTVSFVVSNDNAALFAVAPSIGVDGKLTYAVAPNVTGTATVTVVAKDDGGTADGGIDTSGPQTFTITVRVVNNAPTFSLGAGPSLNEDAGPQTVANFLTALTAGPPDEAGQTVTITVTNDNAALFAAAPAIAADGTLTFTPAADANGSATVTVTAVDNGGTADGGIDTTIKTFTITVNAVNDAPTFTLAGNQTAMEDGGAVSTAAFVTASFAGPADEATQAVSFVVSNDNAALFAVAPAIDATGKLTYTLAADAFGTATVTVAAKDDGGTANGGVDTSAPQTFTITVTAVNDAPTFTLGANPTALEDAGPQEVANFLTTLAAGPTNETGQAVTMTVTSDNPTLFAVAPAIDPVTGKLTFTPAANANGSATVTVTAVDNGGTADGGIDTTIKTFTITVTAVNDAPTFTVGANQTVLEDGGSQAVAGFIATKSAGPADEAGQAVSFVVSNDNNALFAAQPTIDAAGKLTYTLAANAFGIGTVTVVAKDDGGGADTSAAQTFTITVTAVNDAPTFALAAGPTVLEDAGPQAVADFLTALSVGPANEAGQTATVTVTNDNAALFAVAPNIGADGKLTFTPAANANGTATVTVTVQDDGGTANGGADTTVQTFTITVTAVNDAPTFALAGDQSALEDGGPVATAGVVTAISAGPADEASQSVSFLVSNDNNALFSVQPTIGADGKLTFTPATDAFGTATVTVVAVDDGGGADTSAAQTFVITVAPVNDAPTFALAGDPTVLEDAGQQSIANFLSAVVVGPANEADQTFTVEVSNDNNALFSVQPTIDAAGNLTFTPATNANGTARVAVVLRDSGGTADGGVDAATAIFTITVTAVNDAPTFALAAGPTVLEDAAPQTVAGFATASAGPADEAGQLVSFVVSNDNNALFTAQPSIGTDGKLTYTLAANANGSATVTVLAVDDGGGTDTSAPQAFTITVTPVNDAPTFALGVAPATAEDAGDQAVAGFLTALSVGPANETQAATVTVTTDNNALFTAQPSIDASGKLTYTAAPDANGTAVVTVTVQDDGGTANGGTDTTVQTFTITVNPVNDTPTFAVGGNQTVTINVGPQVVVGFVTSVSVGPADEIGQTVSFNVSTNNPALFAVQPAIDASGKLTYTAAADAIGLATVTVTATDSGGGADTAAPQTFLLAVLFKNVAPTFAVGANQAATEDGGAVIVPGFLTNIAAGPAVEAGQTVAFQVTASNPALFSVQPAIDASGQLTYTLAPDANGTTTITVTATDDGGTDNGGDDSADPQTFTLAVAAVNDAPTFAVGVAPASAEDGGAQAVAGLVTGVVVGPADEAAQTVAFQVTTDNPALFAVQPAIDASGKLTYTAAPDAFGVATVTVVAVDSGGAASAPRTFAVAVNPVNDAPSFGLDTSVSAIFPTVVNLTAGPANEAAQTIAFVLTTDNPRLFTTPPVVDASGKVSFALNPLRSGTATITVTATDSGGGTNSATQAFTFAVKAVPVPPSFQVAPNVTVAEDAGAQSVSSFVTLIPGNPEEPEFMPVSVAVAQQTPGVVFTQMPTFDAAGNLTYQVAPDSFGTAVFNAVAANGTPGGFGFAFSINVTPVNDAPTATVPTPTTGTKGVTVSVPNVVAFTAGPNEADALNVIATVVGTTGNVTFTSPPSVDANGTLTYTAKRGSRGTAKVAVTASDGEFATPTQFVTVAVDATGRAELVGYQEFAVGSDDGQPDVTLFNADGSPRFFSKAFPGTEFGARVATGDFTGDGIADLVVGSGPGRTTFVQVIDGATQKTIFAIQPFEAAFTGGVYVAAGDTTGDGVADLVITPDRGGGPRVDVYTGAGFGKVASFFGIEDANFRGGARAAVGDLTGDGAADLVVSAGFRGGPRVAAFDGKSLGSVPRKLFNDFFAFEPTLRNGAFVAVGDVDGDGIAEIIAGGGPNGGPRVTAFDGAALMKSGGATQTQIVNFFAGDPATRGGVRVSVKDLDGDDRADLVVGAGTNTGSTVAAYLGTELAANPLPRTAFEFEAFDDFTGGVFVG